MLQKIRRGIARSLLSSMPDSQKVLPIAGLLAALLLSGLLVGGQISGMQTKPLTLAITLYRCQNI